MYNKLNFIKYNYIIVFYIFVSLLFTFYILGLNNINPLNENWLFENDRAQDLLIWKYFFKDNWRFPLGASENFGLSISNSIVYSGSTPLYAFIFKLFKFVLPSNFNYFSILVFFSIFFQILFGYLIVYRITENKLYSLISSFLFIFLPIFLFKLKFHFSLTSHWLILIYFYVKLLKKNNNIMYLLILLISSLVHFYFTIMILLMIVVDRLVILSFDKKYLSFFKDIFYYLLPLIVLMYLLGYFMFSPSNGLGGGYGQFNLDLISYLNPFNDGVSWSIFLPTLYIDNSESFSYLGLGILMLIINLLFYLIKNYQTINFKKNISYILIFTLLTFLAVSNNIEFVNNSIIYIELNKYIYAIASVIRASARLIWPCVYLILIFGIYSVYKNFNIKTSSTIILLLLVLQVLDIQNGIKQFQFGKEYKANTKSFKDERLEKINKEFKIFSGTNIYNENNDFNQLAPFLAKYMPKTELIYVARVDRKKQSDLTYFNIANFLNKKNDLEKFYYVQTIGQLNHLRKIYELGNVGFFNIEELWFFVPMKKKSMTAIETKFINQLRFNFLKYNKEYYLNDYKNVKNDKIIGLGWFFNKINKKLYSDGERSFLIIDKENNPKSKKIHLTITKPYKDINFNNRLIIIVNNIEVNSFNINNQKEIPIDLTKFDSNEIVIELRSENTKSDFDLRRGIDRKKKSVILKSYRLSDS